MTSSRTRTTRSPTPWASWLLGGPISPSEAALAIAALEEDHSARAEQDANEREGQLRDNATSHSVEEDPYKDNLPSHSFEKIDFADNYDGGARRMDGVDEMDDQGDSLDEVDLREMIRGGPPVESIYRAELSSPLEIPDVYQAAPHERGIPYDEWDQRIGAYRTGWVTLYPTPLPTAVSQSHASWRFELRPHVARAIVALEKLRAERIPRNRQLDGSEIEIEAMIEEYAARRQGRAAQGRVFIHQPKIERDVATCILIDVSDSSDSWVQNRRVLDTEVAAAFILGEAAEHFGDPLAILAFASHTRNLCRVWTVKDWDDSWAHAQHKLKSLKPSGYTRIGPALRHGTQQLLLHPARKKHLILITDGKPTDFDRYEGTHGIKDVQRAVLEAREARVQVQAIGIDPRAARALPTMFGPYGWRLVRHLKDLPDALLQAFA